MSLFPTGRRHFWSKVDHRFSCHPDITPDRLALLTALLYLADGSDSIVAGRDAIMRQAKLGRNKYLAAMRWLREIGAIEDADEPAARSGRRIILRWVREPKWTPAEGPETPTVRTHGGAPTVGAPPVRIQDRGRAQFRTGGAPTAGAPPVRIQARPSYIEIGRDSEDPSRPVEDSPREAHPAPPADPATGRDGFAPPRGDGGGDPGPIRAEAQAQAEAQDQDQAEDQDPARPSAAAIAAAIAERRELADRLLAEAGSPERLERDRARRGAYRLALREIDQLRSGDLSPILPPAPPRQIEPAPPPLPVATRPPAVARDDRVPLAEAIELCRELDAPEGFGPAKADTLARCLSTRWRDPKPETVEHFRAAALQLGSGQLESLIREADAPKVREPAPYFSRIAADAMRDRRRRARQTG